LTAGSLLWQGTYNVTVQKGIFSVLLGDISDAPHDFRNLAFDKPYFLLIKVGGEVMSPRQQITSAGYAIRAEKADLATNAASAQRADVATTLSDVSNLVPRGAIIMCKGSCPTGYARVSELDGRFLVGGVNYVPAAGGNNAHAHATSNHGHTLDSGIVDGITPGEASGVYIGSGGGYLRQKAYVFPQQPGSALKTSTTLAGAETVTSADSRPAFATVVFCEKQ
jgi:hypothetical protein